MQSDVMNSMKMGTLQIKEGIMRLVILSIVTGFIVGFVFAIFKLPIPAPPALPGVTGIVGIYLGFKAFEQVAPWFDSIFK